MIGSPGKIGVEKFGFERILGAHLGPEVSFGSKLIQEGILDLAVGCGPLPVTVTTRIITFLIGNPYKPSFAPVTGRGAHSTYQTFFGASTSGAVLRGKMPI